MKDDIPKSIIINNNDIFNEISYKIKPNSKNNSRKYYLYYDFLRILSSISVVLIHVSSKYYYKLDINSNSWKIAYYYNGMSRFGVPIFIMISGSLFIKKEVSFERLFKIYIKRMLIHYFCWSFIYSLYKIKLNKTHIYKFIINIFQGPSHLWYLNKTITLYLIVPFLKEISSKEELLILFIQLSFIFTFALPNIIFLLSYYNDKVFNILNIIKLKFSVNFLRGHVFYFMLGYYLNNKIKITYYKKIFIYFSGLIGFFITTIIFYYISIMKQEKIRLFSPFNLNVLSYSIAVFIFFKEYFNNCTINKIEVIKKLSNLIFGIYLIHPLIIDYFIKKKYYLFINKMLFKIPLMTLIVYLLSYLFSYLLKKIPLIGKILI